MPMAVIALSSRARTRSLVWALLAFFSWARLTSFAENSTRVERVHSSRDMHGSPNVWYQGNELWSVFDVTGPKRILTQKRVDGKWVSARPPLTGYSWPSIVQHNNNTYMLCSKREYAKASHIYITQLGNQGWLPPVDITPNMGDNCVTTANTGFVVDGGRIVHAIEIIPNFAWPQSARRVVSIDVKRRMWTFTVDKPAPFALNSMLQCSGTFGRVFKYLDPERRQFMVTVMEYSEQSRSAPCKAGDSISYTQTFGGLYGGQDWLTAVLYTTANPANLMVPSVWRISDSLACPGGHSTKSIRHLFQVHYRTDSGVQKIIMNKQFPGKFIESREFGAPYWMEGCIYPTAKEGKLMIMMRINNREVCNIGGLVDVLWDGAKYNIKFNRIGFFPGLSVAHPAIVQDRHRKETLWMLSNFVRDSRRLMRPFPSLKVEPGTNCEADRSTMGLFKSVNSGYDWFLVKWVVQHPSLMQTCAYAQAFIDNRDVLHWVARYNFEPKRLGNHNAFDVAYGALNLTAINPNPMSDIAGLYP